jgi:predicted CXXCH cytochrome family protein
MIYPVKTDGGLQFKEPTSGQQRYFAIPDLQDDQLVLPTGSSSRFFPKTPGSPLATAPPNGQNGNGTRPAAAAPNGTGGEPDPAEQFRLVHTTFGVIHCDSCHNAHSELHAGFLRDKSPQLCLLCHDR